MKILLSNDDGFIAPGINVLRDRLQDVAEVLTIAPDRDRSGASNSLTLDAPLRLVERGKNFYSVNGTPTDCVHLALTGLYEDGEPDIVISGINSGPNMGDDVIYSGTVAAAMEGRNLGLPAIAVSMASHKPEFYESAIQAVMSLLEGLPDLGLTEIDKAAIILNVNVPDMPWDKIKGFQATRLGKRHKAEPVIRSKDPRGSEIFWIGPVGEEADAGEGTDFYAVQNGYVSVTPIHIDLTRYSAIESTEKWLSRGVAETKLKRSAENSKSEVFQKPHKSGGVSIG
jgi:5'-nucleotidase